MAHIFAASEGGPRAYAELSQEERGSYANLILLCPTCHTTIDKAPNDFPDELISRWKQDHVRRIAEVFGAVSYENRESARKAVDPLLTENRAIFDQYGPNNDYRFNPESEIAEAWQRKVLSKILPNNRKLLLIIDANRGLLSAEEVNTLERFRQHVDDLEARHLNEDVASVGSQFPVAMTKILT